MIVSATLRLRFLEVDSYLFLPWSDGFSSTNREDVVNYSPATWSGFEGSEGASPQAFCCAPSR